MKDLSNFIKEIFFNNLEKSFPIQSDSYRSKNGKMIHCPPTSIPWWLAEIVYTAYSKKFGNSQSIERLAERGGFGIYELIYLLHLFNLDDV